MQSTTSQLKSEIVRAGAGAGKTTQLTKNVIDFAEKFFIEHKRMPKIVVTTFTKKATEELRERLVKEACLRQNNVLIQFVTSKSQLHISTIHGVLTLFLHRYGLWLNVDSDFKILDAGESSRILKKQLRNLLIQKPDAFELLQHYSVEQLMVMLRNYSAEAVPVTEVEIINSNKKIIAKLVSKLSNLAHQILSEANDTKWVEFAQRVLTLTVLDNRNLKSWCEELLALSKPRFSSKNPAISSETNDEIMDCLKEFKDLDFEIFDESSVKAYAEVAKQFKVFADEFMNLVSEQKSAMGRIDMSELEALTLRCMKKNPEIAKAFSADWDYWLVDEFQDTSPIQIEILNEFIGSSPVYYVGDPQQSIYLFRGARSEVFAQKEQFVKSHNGKLSTLNVNYRSRPELLMFFNDFFSQLSTQFQPMEPKHSDLNANQVVAQFAIVNKKDEDIYSPLSQFIIEKMHAGARFDDFCILTRTNSDLSVLARYLESLNIPTQIHSSDGFYKRRETLDILTILKFLINPNDNLNLIRLLRSPWFKVEDADLANALVERPIFFWPHLQKNISRHPAIQSLTEALVEVQKWGYFDTVVTLVKKRNILDFSHFHDATGRRESNIWKLLSKIKEGEKKPGFHFTTFVNQAFQGIRSAEGEDELDAIAAMEPNRVNLMTIHKSKGLKFKHVLIPNLDKKSRYSESRGHEMPLLIDDSEKKMTLSLRLGDEQKAMHNNMGRLMLENLSVKEKEETYRLMYVAMTRAEESVLLHWREPVDKNFILNNMKFDFSEGTHKSSKFSYQCVRQTNAPAPYKSDDKGISNVRNQWSAADTLADAKHKISVSRLIEDSTIVKSLPQERDRLSIKSIEAPVFGQHLHKILEKYKYVNSASEIEISKSYYGDKAKALSAAFEYTLSIKNPSVENLIRQGEVEWGFQLQTKRGILEGQIDLWGTIDKQTWIVDYKSGTSRYTEKAFEQLNLYSLAIRHLMASDDLKLLVIYSLEKKYEIRDADSVNEIVNRYSL